VRLIATTIIISTLFLSGCHCFLLTTWSLIEGSPVEGRIRAEASKPHWPPTGHVYEAMRVYKPDHLEYQRLTYIPDNICKHIERWIQEGKRVGIDYYQPIGREGHSIYIEDIDQCHGKDIFQVHLVWEKELTVVGGL